MNATLIYQASYLNTYVNSATLSEHLLAIYEQEHVKTEPLYVFNQHCTQRQLKSFGGVCLFDALFKGKKVKLSLCLTN
jgi:hypothetical protein